MKFNKLFERFGYSTFDDFDTSDCITLENNVKQVRLILDLKHRIVKKESFIDSHSEFLTFDEFLSIFLLMKEKGWF